MRLVFAIVLATLAWEATASGIVAKVMAGQVQAQFQAINAALGSH